MVEAERLGDACRNLEHGLIVGRVLELSGGRGDQCELAGAILCEPSGVPCLVDVVAQPSGQQRGRDRYHGDRGELLCDQAEHLRVRIDRRLELQEKERVGDAECHPRHHGSDATEHRGRVEHGEKQRDPGQRGGDRVEQRNDKQSGGSIRRELGNLDAATSSLRPSTSDEEAAGTEAR